MVRNTGLLIMLLLLSLNVVGQDASYSERAQAYVRRYASFAISDQRSTGVPASVTLGQGILETEAGLSELMVKANNHFGIKCKNGWQGETFLHTDDAKDECFKKYASAQESYHDHSAHLLKNQRYGVLFTYSPTDYARWAHGLKKCGYATNPQYAYQLIKIIEDYHLQEYTYSALDSTYKIKGIIPDSYEQLVAAACIKKQDTSVPVQTLKSDTVVAMTTKTAAITNASTKTDTLNNVFVKTDSAVAMTDVKDSTTADEGKILTVNGLKAFYAHKNEALLPYAVKYKIRYPHLLELNDLPDEPLAFDCYVYLEKKNSVGIKSKHQVREGETLLMIAQDEGMQLKKLAALNLLTPNEQPQTGTALYLQEPAPVKPNVKDVIVAYSENVTPLDNTTTTPEPETISKPAKGTEEVGFGMGFQAPPAAATPIQKKEDTVKQRPAPIAEKKPFTKADPEQPQLKKPATEAVYKKGDKKYIVRRGDTAFSIAKKHGVTVAQLLKWNDMEAQDLKAGQTIIVKE